MPLAGGYRNRPNSKSGLKGVYLQATTRNRDGNDVPLRKPWKAYLRHHWQYVLIGYFATKLEAAIAYNKRAIRQYGAGAYLNPLSRDLA